MAGSVNKVILVGNLGRDPEIRTLYSGDRVANLRIATSESWRDKNTGERKEKTEWHTVVIFNEGLCKVAEQYLKKGSKVYLEGALQTRKWQDQQGQDRWSTEIKAQRVQFLDRKGAARDGDMPQYSEQGEQRSERPSAPAQNRRPQQQQQPQQRQPQSDDLGPAFPSEAGGMDDVPF